MKISLKKPRTVLDWLRLYRVYREAFPTMERKPFGKIRKMYREGRADVWCLMVEGRFRGLATTVNGGDLILLDYFAITKECRGQGFGTQAMKLLLETYDDKGFFLEIESTLEDSSDREARKKRKKFYLDCGLKEMGTEALVFQVRMELLGRGCCLNFEQYRNFYRDHLSPWAAEHLKEIR